MLTAQRDKIWYLQRINIFQDLTAEGMEEIGDLSLMRHYEANHRIFRQGDTASALFLLKEGTVRLSAITPVGKRRSKRASPNPRVDAFCQTVSVALSPKGLTW